MIDREVIHRRLRKLDQLVSRLGRFGSMETGAFAADPLAQAACERLLQVAIQIVLDIGAHLLSDRGVLDWEEYREVPRRLLDVGILSEQLADELARAAGMRNILVHMYLEVDPALVHETVRDHLDVFREFAERVLSELGSG
jgi:uncharacterized protein YutE (UPF0331/DUF86 family)